VVEVSQRRVVRIVGAAVMAVSAVLSASIAVPAASAADCPDVEVVFARGTGEAPGVGGVGQAFVDALRSQVGGRSVGVYAVNYAASSNFDDHVGLVQTVVDGVRDAGARVQSLAANCPNTKVVLGGYSQGAVAAGFVTSADAPSGLPVAAVPAPLPPAVADHVAAVALFGEPSAQFLQSYGAPPVVIGPTFAPKTIDLCAPGDTICDGTAGGGPTVAHALYGVNGMVGQAATFVAGRF
jgi:cutinase